MLYQKSVHTWISFLDPKDLCLPNQFSEVFCQYILNLMSKKKLGSFNDLINSYFQSTIFSCHIFWRVPFVKIPWHCWTEFSQCWKDLRKTLPSHENLRSLTIWVVPTLVSIQIQETGCFENQSINEQKRAVLERCVNSIFYLHRK